ncbi:MAG: hypothetical protein ABIR16_01565, partial [Dokdonella sp.]
PLANASAMNEFCNSQERAGVDGALACAVVGSPESVRDGMQAFVNAHRPDELLLTANIFDHTARLRSFELAMQASRSA